MSDFMPARVNDLSQQTAVEQARAVAEVIASIEAARRWPRNVAQAKAMLAEACRVPALAEAATYRFKRGTSTVTGPTIELMEEVARCWGHIHYGTAELRNDDIRTEMLAFALDLESLNRASIEFIATHRRYGATSEEAGAVVLSDPRDLYENNQSQGSRRMRTCLERVIPTWFIEAALEACRRQRTHGDDRPVAERADAALQRFGAFGVTEAAIVAKVGRPVAEWTAEDLGDLLVVHRSIATGESSVTVEFPATVVTGADLDAVTGPAAVTEGDQEDPEPEKPKRTRRKKPPPDDPPEEQPAAAGTEPPAPATLAEFRRLVGRQTSRVVTAVQKAFPDRAGELATLDNIYADPQALDRAMSVLGQ